MRHRNPYRAAAIAFVGAALMTCMVGAARAADVTGGCTLIATSLDSAGKAVDSIKGPGYGGTETRPFAIDGSGSLTWTGTTPAPITQGTWTVSIGGNQVMSGDINNPAGTTSKTDTTKIADLPALVRLPIQWVLLSDGKLEAGATVQGSGQSCSGTVWITGVGSPTGSPLFWTAAGIALLAAILLWVLITTTTETTTGVSAGAATGAVGPPSEQIPGMEVK